MRGRFGWTVTGRHDARAVMLKRGVMWWWGWLGGWWRWRSWWGVGGLGGREVVREEKCESSGAHHHDGGADLEHLRVGRMENRQEWEALRRRAHFGFPPPLIPGAAGMWKKSNSKLGECTEIEFQVFNLGVSSGLGFFYISVVVEVPRLVSTLMLLGVSHPMNGL